MSLLAWLSLSAIDYVIQGLLVCLIFIVPWFVGQGRGYFAFLMPLAAICLWGMWRMFHFDPVMRNDVPGIGYFVAAGVYSFLSWVLFQTGAAWKKWWRRGREVTNATDSVDKWTYLPDAPIVGYASRNDEPRQEAYRQAAETMPDFIEHIKVKDGRLCAAKLSFKDPEESARLGRDQVLYWWLSFATYDAEKEAFSAEFTELPECLKPYHHIGQRLWFEAEDVFDWYANDEGRLFGGFTIRVSYNRIPESERASYERYVGITEFMDGTSPINLPS